MTVSTPRSCSRRAARAAVASQLTRTPVSDSASDSFGVKTDTFLRSANGSGMAGAGFSMTRAPTSRAIRAAASTEANGVSSCSKTTAAPENAFFDREICVADRLEFAPGDTAMLFSPVAETNISATPEVSPSTRETPRTSTPSLTRLDSARSPKSSRPTHPTNWTSPPARLAATAWFAPLPPATTSNRPPSTVSPGRGKRGTRTTMSVLLLPTTTILFLLAIPSAPASIVSVVVF